MRRRTDPLLRAALLIHRRLVMRAGRHDPPARIGSELPDACRQLIRTCDRLRTARRRGWMLAARRLEEQALAASLRVRQASAALAHADTTPIPPPPSPAVLWAELRQLSEEFPEEDLDLTGNQIVVRTEPIVLEGLHLGPFAIELHLDRLHYFDSSCFDCVALEPNSARNNDSVTHPHVQDKGLCAGDASYPIAQALRQGRLCDAFLLVAGVLRSYNPASPYVSLNQWDGVSCPGCDATVQSDELYYCEHCERDVCDDCCGVCDVCHTRCCQSCLEYDAEANQTCCPSCRETCGGCGRWVSNETYDAPSGLCPKCLADRQLQPQPQEEVDHEPEDNSTAPRASETGTAA